jgi:DeoR family suf operon transcriptional repressor
MKSTRERVLQTLLLNPNSTISDLATAVDINTISVRHHLTGLQAEGLILAQEERHGVGRPRLVYSLTEKGAELFPTRYVGLVNQLLFQLKNQLSKKEMEKILNQIALEITDGFAEKNHDLPIKEKLKAIQQFLLKEGFLIEWKQDDNGNYIISEISCPFYHVSQVHPEVCMIDRTILSTLLSSPVKRITCILSGDNHCSYLYVPTLSTENNQ